MKLLIDMNLSPRWMATGALLTVDLLRSRIRLLPILGAGAQPGDDAEKQ